MAKTIKINSTLDASITDQMKEDVVATIEYSEPVDVYVDSNGNKVTGENLVKTTSREINIKQLKERKNNLIGVQTTTQAEIDIIDAEIAEISLAVNSKIPKQ